MTLAAAAAAPAQTAAEWVARGDSLMREYDTGAALEAYLDGVRAHPDDPTLLWKASRAQATLAVETPGTEGDEARLAEAVELGRRAVAAGPDVARAHTALAAALGLYGRHVAHAYRITRAREVIAIAREAYKEALRALELDPRDYGPYVILGLWHRELTTVHPIAKMVARTFLGGYPDVSLEKSAAYLRSAVRLAPDDVTARLELGRTYLEMDREADARRELEAALASPATERLDRIEQRKARDLLATLS